MCFNFYSFSSIYYSESDPISHYTLFYFSNFSTESSGHMLSQSLIFISSWTPSNTSTTDKKQGSLYTLLLLFSSTLVEMCLDIGIVTCGPNEALIISGIFQGANGTLVVGGRAIVLPGTYMIFQHSSMIFIRFSNSSTNSSEHDDSVSQH